MSKRDIETVCTLAAHLALRDLDNAFTAGIATGEHMNASKAAQDAMTLQRLGRSTRNAVKRYAGRGNEKLARAEWAFSNIKGRAEHVLSPYGLKATFRDDPVLGAGLVIIGLPSNGDGEGFAI